MTDDDIDYRDLLKRYMWHVLEEEGTTCIGPWDFGRDLFSENEKDVLRQIDSEAE